MKITAWSPSRLFKYEECPRKAKFAYVDKIPEPGPKAEHLVKGERMHADLEHYVKGFKPDLPEDLAKMRIIAAELRAGYQRGEVRAEVELAVRRDWSVTSWFAKDAWGRFKLDIVQVMEKSKGRVLDWKSGKYKPDGDYADQLNAYSTAALAATPSLESMTSALIFAEHTDIPVERPEGSIHRDELDKWKEYWTKRVAKMENDTVFAPRPSPMGCKYCPYSRNKGGPCEF